MPRMKQEWDGNDYQFYVRFIIVVCCICLVIDHLTAPSDPELFWLSIFFLVIGSAIVPEGPRAPRD